MAFFWDDNLKNQKKWMYKTQNGLNQKSPWDLLNTGDIADLWLVAHHVNRTLG